MIKNYANKVMDYEYNAFMTLMNVSVSKHLFDEHFTVLWANDYFYQLIGYTKDEYEASFHNHVDEYFKNDPDAVALMGEIITKAYQQQEPGYEFECPMQVKSGKTTWMKLIAGLSKPEKGEIFYEGHPLCAKDKESIAYMATENFFYSYMKIKDVEKYYTDFFAGFDRAAFWNLIGKTGLDGEMKVRELSSGMNAKLRIAATLARKAKLTLLDEPLNGVDFKAREQIVEMILRQADESRTIVMSTHLIEEIESYVEEAIFIKGGKLADVVNLERERMTTGRSLTELYMQLM